MIKLKLFLLFFVFNISAFSQLYNGTDFSVTNGGVLSVINSSVVNGATGDLKNAGTIYVDANIQNAGLLDGFATTTGVFMLGENWINNGVFNADASIVDMFGNDQSITGTVITTFYDLRLNGFGVKLQTLNSQTQFLDLTSNELATSDYIMDVLSTDVNAILRTTGFVSSTNNGFLSRNTDQANQYLFPTGSFITGNLLYRPIIITPTDASLNQYGVRLANTSADTDGYSFLNKDPRIKKFNTSFYHHLYNRISSNGADITFHYDPSIDGDFQRVGQWSSSGMWLSEFNEIESANATFSTLAIPNTFNFNSRAFILVNKLDEMFIQNAFSPNNDNINDQFVLNLNKEDFLEFEFMIFNRWGQRIFKTKEPSITWDGKFKGKELPIGVYPWRMIYRQNNEIDVKVKQGHITVIK
jgi:gliding motility-associated-like protein